MPDSNNLSDPGREALTSYESNNGWPETESFRRGHGGLGLAGVFLLIEIPACVDGFLRRPACGKIAGLRA